jgi:predicted nucleic-acid-binding Zn-ribbon protein
MALNPAALEKATQFINEKWRSKTCHLCGANNWVINGYVVLSVGDTPLDVVLGGQALPCVAMVCKNCGNTHLINVFVAGMVAP